MPKKDKIIAFLVFLALLIPYFPAHSQSEFNPNFIISDEEMQSTVNWAADDIQKFLESKGSYLAAFFAEDIDGIFKRASEIIYQSAQRNQINPKYILVTLQKEQSLITEDSPTQKQLDWATGYGVCDGCYLSDPNVLKHKGFGKQVDNSAGIIRWYYENTEKSFVKKKDQTTIIDKEPVIPGSWATAFLYTYTPHLHGNKNFWRIWNTWFAQVYPNGTLLKSASSSEIWLIQNNVKRKFKNQATLLSRANPDLIISIPDIELNNYQTGAEIAFPNYSILKVAGIYYLLDYDTLRPFASDEVFRQIGYNPDEVIGITAEDIAGYTIGTTINTTSTAPQGVIYQITDLSNAFYLYKDNVLYPITDEKIVDENFSDLKIEQHKLIDIKNLPVADMPLPFKDGTLLRISGGNSIFVMENGKKRKIADNETFKSMGYKKSNVITVQQITALGILTGEPIFLNSSLLSSRNKFLGDSLIKVDDIYRKSKVPAYLIAEYPSGRIISGKDIDTPRPIASLTKLFVAYEALNQDFDLKKISTYDKKIAGSSGHILNLKNGAKLKNLDLFSAMLIGSYNNTARMVAQASGLSEDEFIRTINKRLENWDADDTTIADVTGLDESNKSTPRNLLKIFTKILENDLMQKTLFEQTYQFKEMPSKAGAQLHTIANTNQLLKLSGRNYRILASKTGYTDEAGSVMVMLVEGRKTKKKFVIVTLGNKDYKNRFNEPNNLAKWIASGQVKIANVQ